MIPFADDLLIHQARVTPRVNLEFELQKNLVLQGFLGPTPYEVRPQSRTSRTSVLQALKAYYLKSTHFGGCSFFVTSGLWHFHGCRANGLQGRFAERTAVLLRKQCRQKGAEIIEAECCPDHIHMLTSIPPKYSASQIMGYLKEKSSLMIFDRHANPVLPFE